MRVLAALITMSIGAFWTNAAFAASAQDAFGTWLHPENGSHIRVYKCGGGLCAKVVKVKDPSRRDIHNPNPKLRNRPVEGVVIMNGARKTGANTWRGRLYNTRDGKTYTGVITVVNENTLKLEGCVLGGLFCKGVNWKRIK